MVLGEGEEEVDEGVGDEDRSSASFGGFVTSAMMVHEIPLACAIAQAMEREEERRKEGPG